MKKSKFSGAGLLRAAIYIRVSTDVQASDGDSMREQLASCKRYIDEHDNLIFHDSYVDDGVSGQKLQRNDFQRLIDDVKSNQIDIIIFTRLDRWFRNLRHYLNTQAVLDAHNVSWIAIAQEYFDTTTPQGRAFVNNSMIWAELEAQNDSERILRVFDDKVRRGEVISGSTPIGYKIENKHLVPDEDAPKAIAMFECYARCGNLTETLHYLENEFGIVRSAASLKRLLSNTKYIGVFRDNDHFCTPLIDPDLFYDVQRKLKINIKSNKKHDYIFPSLVVCDCCNHRMSGMQTNSTGYKNGRRYYHHYPGYRCRQACNLHRCENRKTQYESSLERYVLSNVRPQLESYLSDYEIAQRPAVDLSAKRNKIENKLQRLKDLYLNDLITLDEFKADRAELTAQLQELSAAPVQPDRNLDFLRAFLASDFEDIYSSLSVLDRQRLWRSVIREIRVDAQKNIRIIFL